MMFRFHDVGVGVGWFGWFGQFWPRGLATFMEGKAWISDLVLPCVLPYVFPCVLPCVLPCVSLVFCPVFCLVFPLSFALCFAVRFRARARAGDFKAVWWSSHSPTAASFVRAGVGHVHHGVGRHGVGRARPSALLVLKGRRMCSKTVFFETVSAGPSIPIRVSRRPVLHVVYFSVQKCMITVGRRMFPNCLNSMSGCGGCSFRVYAQFPLESLKIQGRRAGPPWRRSLRSCISPPKKATRRRKKQGFLLPKSARPK